jgi:anti-sigma factor RsiW
MSRNDEILSAYLDGEVPEPFASEIQRSLEQDPEMRARYAMLQQTSAYLHQVAVPDVQASQRRVWNRVMAQSGASHNTTIWTRRVGIPLPLVAAVALMVVAFSAVTVWNALRPTDARGYLAGAQDVEVTIRVDNGQMEQVMEWLVKENMLGEVNIQLPSDQRFEFLGEPVLLRAAEVPEPAGGVAQ